MTDDLVTWLREQIAEDERIAQAASPGPWRANAEHDEVVAVDGITVCDGFALSSNQLRATVDHIARHDPASVLAQCEAHRRIIDACAPLVDPDGPYYDDDDSKTGVNLAEDAVLPALALAYQHRPGYRSEWRA